MAKMEDRDTEQGKLIKKIKRIDLVLAFQFFCACLLLWSQVIQLIMGGYLWGICLVVVLCVREIQATRRSRASVLTLIPELVFLILAWVCLPFDYMGAYEPWKLRFFSSSTMAALALLFMVLRGRSLAQVAIPIMIGGVFAAICLGVWLERREHALQIAIVKADVPEIKRLIAKGYDVNERKGPGRSAIHNAFYYGHPPRGGDGFYYDDESTFWEESEEQKEAKILEVIKVLLDNGADIDDCVQGSTSLHEAIDNRQIRIAELLLKRGADPDMENCSRRTPLYRAAGDRAMVELLRKYGVRETPDPPTTEEENNEAQEAPP